MDLKQYYLDFEKIKSLSLEESNKVHEYYREMLYSIEDDRKNITISLFNTLIENGFLKDLRNEKLDDILNGDKGIDT